MYDDAGTDKLNVPAGSLKNGPVEEPKEEKAAPVPVEALLHKKHHHKHLRKGQ